MKIDSRQKLIHSAIKILCLEPLATMDRIAEASDVSRMTLFRVFKSRQQLINILIIESYDVCSKIVNESFASQLTAREKVEQSIKALIPVGAMFRFLYYVPWRSQDAEVIKREKVLYEKWRYLLEELKRDGDFRPEISIDWGIKALDALILSAWDSIDDGEIAPKTAHEQVIGLFFQGVTNKNNRNIL